MTALPDRTDRAAALARTYGGDRDGWTRVQEYQRVQEYAAANPNAGSSAVASALELPRGRVRPWLDGTKPDPAHAVATADQQGWLDAQPGDRTFEALSLLTAWLYAGGSLDTTHFMPHLSVSDGDPRALGHELFTAVRIDSELLERGGGKGAEIRPTGDGITHLGRYLHAVMGAPAGTKAEQVQLPQWLAQVPRATQTRWVQLYVCLRGVVINGGRIQLQEQRSHGYRTGLAAIIRTVVDDVSAVTVGDVAVRIAAEHAPFLDVVPRLPDG
jgi:hypothetical protein